MNVDLKGCSKCKIEKLMINFHKNNKGKDDLYSRCKSCRKQKYNEKLEKIIKYYLDNRDRIKDYYLDNRDRIKEYQLKNHDKIFARKKIYSISGYKTDINLRLICKTRSRIRQALNRKIKSSSTLGILGIGIDTYKN